jgi:hypothetical protein
MSRTGPGKQAYDERLSEEFSGGVHDYEKMLLANEPAVTGITTQKGTEEPVLIAGVRDDADPGLCAFPPMRQKKGRKDGARSRRTWANRLLCFPTHAAKNAAWMGHGDWHCYRR